MENKRFWYLIGIGVILMILFIFVSNIISVGERLRSIHSYVEYGFYGLSAILLYVLFINPIRVIVLAPTFSVEAILDDEFKRHAVYKKAAKKLLDNPVLTEEDKELLRANLSNKEELKSELTKVFSGTIKEEINKVIIKNSKTVMVSTALSQNGNLDMISVIGINLKMIREITELTGFRPTTPKLAKLSLNVLTTSLIAEGLDDAEISELLPNKFSEALTDLPFVKTLSNSIMSGIANGLLTCRVGVVTQKYLFMDSELLSKKEIRRMAIKESLKLMPSVISGGLAAFPKGVASIFSRPFKKKDKEE
jgi:hypothetical protein